MIEDSAKNIDINDLFDMLMKSTKELVELIPKEHTTEYQIKKEQVQLLQRIIIQKRSEFRPGSPL
jgi:phosphorylcholine metabolism protein LicD